MDKFVLKLLSVDPLKKTGDDHKPMCVRVYAVKERKEHYYSQFYSWIIWAIDAGVKLLTNVNVCA